MTPRPVSPLMSVTAPSFTCNMHLTCSLLSRAMYPWILDQPRTALSPPGGGDASAHSEDKLDRPGSMGEDGGDGGME